MIDWLRFHWHRLRELMLDRSSARHYAEAVRRRNAGSRDYERARRHGDTADWLRRLLDRAKATKTGTDGPQS